MESNSVKIIECFQIKDRGLITELQHYKNGIPPGTIVTDPESGNSWIIKKRILTGILMVEDKEIFFECETEFEHVSSIFKTIEDRESAIQKELNRRKDGIYWYLLTPLDKNDSNKPLKGSILKIEC